MDLASALVPLAHALQAYHPSLKAVGWLLTVTLIPFVLFGLQEDASVRCRRAATWIARGLVAGYAVAFAATMAANVTFPPLWDFSISWLNGAVAAHGLNFYEPASYQRLADALPATADLSRFVVSVGFHFPPPTIFLFLPLGFFDVHTAYVLWYGAMLAVMVLDVVLLARLFLGGTARGLLLASVLLLTLRPAMATVWFGQTNFLVLLMMLLLWRDRATMRGGAWLALGVLIKPVCGLLMLYVVFRQRWRTLAGAALTVGGASLLTISVFGWHTFAAYFVHNPVARMPTDVYTESMNQSLLAQILRLSYYDFAAGSPLTHPVFVLLAASLVAATIFLATRPSADDDLVLALTIPLALLLYPGTLAHYSVDLLVPLLALWSRRRTVPGGALVAIALLTIEFAILNAADSVALIGNAVAWLAIATAETYRLLGLPADFRFAWRLRFARSTPVS